MKTLVSLAFLSILLLLSAGDVFACSCRANQTVDNKFEKSAYVAVFKLQSIEIDENASDGRISRNGHFSVEKVFKGDIKAGEILTFSLDRYRECGVSFGEESIGEEHLFYVTPEETNGRRIWAVSACSGSKQLDNGDARGDLLYLEKLATVKDKTRISGQIEQSFGSAIKDEPSEYKTLPNFALTITGPDGKPRKLKTDEYGFYEIYGLPPGTYRITPAPIRGYNFGHEPAKPYISVTLKGKSVIEAPIIFSIENSVKGRVLSSAGKALEDVEVWLVPAEGERSDYFSGEAETDAQGNFIFDGVPAGQYFILANPKGKITPTTPFSAVYYPGSANREEAGQISIAAGQHIKGLTITAPKTAETITVSGVLRYEDGKPVADHPVEFKEPPDKEDEERGYQLSDAEGRTDANGRFSFKILKGQKGTLYSEDYVFEGLYENCPKVDKIIEKNVVEPPDPKTGARSFPSAIVRTNEKEIDATDNIENIELTFPFPLCKKKEK